MNLCQVLGYGGECSIFRSFRLKEKQIRDCLFFLLILFTWFPLVLCESESCSVVSSSLLPHGLYSPWNFLGQNTGMGSLSLLQGIFPTQGLNSGLLHCRQILYQLSHKGSPRTLEWVAYPFSNSLPDPGIEPRSPALQAAYLPTELQLWLFEVKVSWAEKGVSALVFSWKFTSCLRSKLGKKKS